MTDNEQTLWTDRDFDRLSWHDTHIHGFGLREGQYGAGTLIFDLDFILEWICEAEGRARFRIAPADLVFTNATDLRVTLDYASVSAGLSPFSIDGMRRENRPQTGAAGYRWTLPINWPKGEIAFEAEGFRLQLRGPAVTSDQQFLTVEQRGGQTGLISPLNS